MLFQSLGKEEQTLPTFHGWRITAAKPLPRPDKTGIEVSTWEQVKTFC